MTVFEVGQRIEKAGLKTRQFDHHESYVWRFDGSGSLTVNYVNGEYKGYVVDASENRAKEIIEALHMGEPLVNKKNRRKKQQSIDTK